MYNIIYEMSRQSRFDARYWILGAGALGRPRRMVWGGRREEGSGWGTYVYLWRIHFDIWQNQYNIVKFKNKIKLKKKSWLHKNLARQLQQVGLGQQLLSGQASSEMGLLPSSTAGELGLVLVERSPDDFTQEMLKARLFLTTHSSAPVRAVCVSYTHISKSSSEFYTSVRKRYRVII